MRNHSGTDENSNGNQDKALKDHEGQGGPGDRGGDFTEGESFEVAADRDEPDGERSPSKSGRGEAASRDDEVDGGE